MEIIAIAKPTASGAQVLICKLVEAEVDKITGIAGKPHSPHRYKAGAKINLGKIYNRVKYLNEKMDEILAAAAETKINADEITNSYPIEEIEDDG